MELKKIIKLYRRLEIWLNALPEQSLVIEWFNSLTFCRNLCQNVIRNAIRSLHTAVARYCVSSHYGCVQRHKNVFFSPVFGADFKRWMSVTVQVQDILTSRDGKSVSVSITPLIITRMPYQKCGKAFSSLRRDGCSRLKDWKPCQ
jgi:hypothetical protein